MDDKATRRRRRWQVSSRRHHRSDHERVGPSRTRRCHVGLDRYGQGRASGGDEGVVDELPNSLDERADGDLRRPKWLADISNDLERDFDTDFFASDSPTGRCSKRHQSGGKRKETARKVTRRARTCPFQSCSTRGLSSGLQLLSPHVDLLVGLSGVCLGGFGQLSQQVVRLGRESSPSEAPVRRNHQSAQCKAPFSYSLKLFAPISATLTVDVLFDIM
jgi:hypothetical protein